MLGWVLFVIIAAPIAVLSAHKLWQLHKGIIQNPDVHPIEEPYTTIHFNYSGHQCCTPRSYDIPQDHGEYAKLFSPASGAEK